MNKLAKLLLVSGMAATMLCALGCGDEKKPEPKQPAAPAATQKPAATKANDVQPEAELTRIAKKPTPENTNPNAPKPLSSLYVYRTQIKNPEEIQYMTPEVVKAFEKEAQHFKLDEGKKWVYSTAVRKPNPNITTYTHMWIGALPENHYRQYKVDNVAYYEEHLGYITIGMNPQTNKITRIESSRSDRTEKDGKNFKKTVFTKESFK